jgi:hypothetical protein
MQICGALLLHSKNRAKEIKTGITIESSGELSRSLIGTLHGLIMSAVKFLTIAQPLMWLLMSACAAEDDRTVTRFLSAEVSLSDGFKKCHSNQDCVLVATGCDHCCQTQAIHGNLLKEFEAKFLAACEGYSRGVCDCVAGPSQAICDNHRCETKLKGAAP